MEDPIVSEERDRVRAHSPDEGTRRVDRDVRERVGAAAAARDDRVERRLGELDDEWDIEQWLMTNASVLALVGVGLGALFSPWWLLLPTVVLVFLLQHAIQGWCPPVEVFRRLGVRTQQEIDAERVALKAVRGDFEHTARDAERAIRAAGV
jgi:hypothetical protein